MTAESQDIYQFTNKVKETIKDLEYQVHVLENQLEERKEDLERAKDDLRNLNNGNGPYLQRVKRMGVKKNVDGKSYPLNGFYLIDRYFYSDGSVKDVHRGKIQTNFVT